MLIGVGIRQGGSPLRRLSGAIAAAQNASTDAACTQTPGGRRGLELGDARVDDISDRAGIPTGERHPTCWLFPQKSGSLASRFRITGSGGIASANMAAGRDLSATLAGSGDITNAAMGLVVSLVASIGGSGGITSAAIEGALFASATLGGSGGLSGQLEALANMAATLGGAGGIEAGITAIGSLSADIVGFGELTPENFVRTLMNYQNAIKQGMTYQEALRTMFATTAGLSDGGGTGTRTYETDGKDRVTATVDSNGNRTGITYDPSE